MMADPNLLAIWTRLARTCGKVTIREDDDDLGLLGIDLTRLRDVVTPVAHAHVKALAADERWESAREVSRFYTDLFERDLGKEVARTEVAPVAKVVVELRAALDTTASAAPPDADVPISTDARLLAQACDQAFSGDSPTLAQAITAIVYLRDLRVSELAT
jgi:hypothetical protein